ncbi:MAG: hypothetical protein SFW64_03710 [Alphaproteobacteria bacterium]|nr:hypothetical protein [Alphaproteobacteria bacterium]
MRFFQTITPVIAALSLSGCAYLIPPEANGPRNNTVPAGAPHRPQFNPGGGAQNAVPPRDKTPVADVAAVAPVAEPVAVAAAPLLPVTTAPNGDAARRVPVENAAFQLAGNYPPLDAVPPRPVLTGPDSAQSRLRDTQDDLERERAVAQESKDALTRDAAAEPSIPLPVEGAASPALPAAPIPPRDENRRIPRENGAALTLPPPPSGAFAVTETSPPPLLPPVARQPIRLRPPVAEVADNAPLATRAGDFDPLATASAGAPTASAARYAANRYIAPSRYASRRN